MTTSGPRQLEAVRRALDTAEVAYAVLGSPAEEPEDDAAVPRVTVVPATLAKGLEFDSVVVLEPRA